MRFLPINENCEFHIRDLDSRLSLTDKNIIEKFYEEKYCYVPYYTFQFYKHYFSKLKWRIDSNPYLGGCWGGDNRIKTVMLSKDLLKNENLKILQKEFLFNYILFMSLNSTNLQIGFLNDEFILASIFEKIKGEFSENILYLNLGSFSNKHVNEYYFGFDENPNYPCVLKLGVPVNILKYELNGNYISIDPIVDFKIGFIKKKYNNLLKHFIIEQLNLYLNYSKTRSSLSKQIEKYYNDRRKTILKNELEYALFFSMTTNNDSLIEYDEIKEMNNNSLFGFAFTVNTHNIDLKPINFMMAGYLNADILEDIIFPKNPKFINSNELITSENYDRLFNCLYFNENKKSFVQKKINKQDLKKKYFDKTIISKIDSKYIDITKDDIKIINIEFNKYIKNCITYPSMYFYLTTLKTFNYVNINGILLKTNTLYFIENKDNLPIHTILYDININNNVEKVKISKYLQRFNIIFFDDKYIYQMVYHDTNNKSKINLQLLKSKDIHKLIKNKL